MIFLFILLRNPFGRKGNLDRTRLPGKNKGKKAARRERDAAGGEKADRLGDERPQTPGGSVRAYGKQKGKLSQLTFVGQPMAAN